MQTPTHNPRQPQQGVCSPATGPFEHAHGTEDAVRLAAPFFGSGGGQDEESGGPPASCQLAGERLVVVQRTAGGFCAVSRRRALGVAARHLPCGVLLASFEWPTPAQRVVAELDRCCAALQG